MRTNNEAVLPEGSHWTSNEQAQVSDPVLDWYTRHDHGD